MENAASFSKSPEVQDTVCNCLETTWRTAFHHKKQISNIDTGQYHEYVENFVVILSKQRWA